MNNLEILKTHKQQLLAAEALGWLHDYAKCSTEFLQKQSLQQPAGIVNNSGVTFENVFDFLINSVFPSQNAKPLEISDGLSNVTLKSEIFDLLNIRLLRLHNIVMSKNNLYKKYFKGLTGKKEKLLFFLSRCHNTSHFDKQEPEGGQQVYPGTKISTPFGYERDVPDDLTVKLKNVPWCDWNSSYYNEEKRKNLFAYLAGNFSCALGDNRRPVNEIDLWSWGLLVGSLYKSTLAGVLLAGIIPEVSDLRWRLLSVRVKGLDYISGALRLPDLSARRRLLTDALDRVRDFLEVVYPLGSEVYRDENGSVFVVPDIDNLLDITDGNNVPLKKLIKEEFAKGNLKEEESNSLSLKEELGPGLRLEEKGWWGQDPDYKNKKLPQDELPRIGEMLSYLPVNEVEPHLLERYWQDKEASDICTVCGLRPQSSKKKALKLAVCEICEQRRVKRSEEWATKALTETVWMDEVADRQGRMALVAGKFHLERWLDGTCLESLLVIPPKEEENVIKLNVTSKTPSFSRLRRIWETTKRFWGEVQQETIGELCLERPRLEIYLKAKSETKDLSPYHVYDLQLDSGELDVVLLEREKACFLSASNLVYTASRLGAEGEDCRCPRAAAVYVKNYLQNKYMYRKEQFILLNPEKKGNLEKKVLEGATVEKIEFRASRYSPVISILAEPQSFMMLVPADQSLSIVRKIKEKYEREMGKVRDRLPLQIGVIYTGRRTPLRTILEAGRSMLDKPLILESCTVKEVKRKDKDLQLLLQNKCKTLTWSVPLYMGDGVTEDNWYPYVILEGRNSCSLDYATRRQFEKELELEKGKKCKYTLVHAADLKVGERVLFWPSTFDFEYIDHNARRFEIVYTDQGRCWRPTRPYYLEELTRLEHIWSVLKKLSSSQLRQIITRIEMMREDWYVREGWKTSLKDKVFHQLVLDTLAGAGWPLEKGWWGLPPEERELLLQAGISGELFDLAELHLEILKE
jgi:hypothetical protein